MADNNPRQTTRGKSINLKRETKIELNLVTSKSETKGAPQKVWDKYLLRAAKKKLGLLFAIAFQANQPSTQMLPT